MGNLSLLKQKYATGGVTHQQSRCSINMKVESVWTHLLLTAGCDLWQLLHTARSSTEPARTHYPAKQDTAIDHCRCRPRSSFSPAAIQSRSTVCAPPGRGGLCRPRRVPTHRRRARRAGARANVRARAEPRRLGAWRLSSLEDAHCRPHCRKGESEV